MDKLSLVIPCYQSGKFISQLVERCLSTEFGENIELILVDDGSTDDSWDQILRAVASYANVKACRLSQNYGEHSALWVGLQQSEGDYIFTMDDDLQHCPEEIVSIYKSLLSGHDLVYGQYRESSHNVFRRIASKWNGWLAWLLLGRPRGVHLSSFRGISRVLLHKVLHEQPASMYLDGVLLQNVTSLGTVQIEHSPSALPQSRYTFKKLFSLHLNMMFMGLFPRKRSTKIRIKELVGSSWMRLL